MEYIEARANQLPGPDASPSLAWMLLIPVFFFTGWFAHSITTRPSLPVYPQVGIGGGPAGLGPEAQLRIYELTPDETSLPANISPAPDHSRTGKIRNFTGRSAVDQT